MKKLLLVALFAVGIGQAQIYKVTKNTVLAATAEAITIQQPATGARQVTFISVYVDSTVAVTFTLSVNGTAATSTSLAVNNVNPGETAAKTTAWSGSNVGAGTTIQTFGCSAACNLSIDLTGFTFPQGGSTTGTNLTMKTTSITGTVNITFTYKETSL
jgi:hypothetical protein